MSKIIDITKLLKAINDGMPKAKAIKESSRDSNALNCEECGIFAPHLHLSAQGFFYCPDCHKHYIRMKAVQDFDNG